ncbi:MAG TPA: hypothetical protein VMN37_12040 [Gemmatimonadales bacterium]|nr:hypothetical protein [Gemmatimonadales bacterium]
MDREKQQPLNTREFVALWNEAREEHLGQRLTAALAALALRGVLPPLSETQIAVLAHAVQLAADPSAGPPMALQYLETLAGDPAPGDQPGA